MGWFLGPLFLVYWGTGFTFLSRSVICWWASRLVLPWLEQIGQLQRRILKVAVACWLSLLSIWPGMVQLDCAIVLLLVSWGSILISTVAAPITRPPALNRAGSSFLACLAISILIYFLEVASLDGVVQNLRTVLIFIAQMARESEHLSNIYWPFVCLWELSIIQFIGPLIDQKISALMRRVSLKEMGWEERTVGEAGQKCMTFMQGYIIIKPISYL